MKYNRNLNFCKGFHKMIEILFFMENFYLHRNWLAEGLSGMAAALSVGGQR